MPYKRGEVVRVDFGEADGHTQAGPRPAVIVQRDLPGKPTSTVMVVPLTSKLQALARFPYAVRIEPDQLNGLTYPSVALVHQLQAVDVRDVDRSIGKLSSAALADLDDALNRVLGLSQQPP